MQGHHPLPSQPCFTNGISALPVVIVVDFSIHLHSEPDAGAEEIQNVWADRMLSAEMDAIQPVCTELGP